MLRVGGSCRRTNTTRGVILSTEVSGLSPVASPARRRDRRSLDGHTSLSHFDETDEERLHSELDDRAPAEVETDATECVSEISYALGVLAQELLELHGMEPPPRHDFRPRSET